MTQRLMGPTNEDHEAHQDHEVQSRLLNQGQRVQKVQGQNLARNLVKRRKRSDRPFVVMSREIK